MYMFVHVSKGSKILPQCTNPDHGKLYSIQHYVIKFVSDLRQVGGFLRELQFPPPKKNDCNDITEILLRVILNTVTLIL
jgi:hypothetical protein